ncbi:unnamed protein product [Vitrella brassicaformis CCMP3155]|uniref:Uncharacterized protein n=1 Tax=Vitrella brassicaformis (strain CCMP3155) TaxID=1169540 RepID=A0A0G4GZY3_VITBC|nr:unnamed protein product [Vitrella brassicaformis CCMP3155]|eukprot:CEM36850.1 unnamed protein product [Vitrella brassicaformis CCMP3155]
MSEASEPTLPKSGAMAEVWQFEKTDKWRMDIQKLSKKTQLKKAKAPDEVSFSFPQFFIDLIGHVLFYHLALLSLPVLYWLYGGPKGGYFAMRNRLFLGYDANSINQLLQASLYMVAFYI